MPAAADGTQWIGDTFVRSALGDLGEEAVVGGLDVRFRLVLPGFSNQYVIQLQPRSGVEEALYVNVNDHRSLEEGGELPAPGDIQGQFEDSIERIEEQLFPRLFGDQR